ncbi:MAG: KH domain-containing protein [Bacilli bacterium]|nr:KH domain-containing protein [Bacilli bacterium]
MDLVLLTEELVKALAINKEAVSVKEFESDDDDTIVIQVMIDNDDMGRVIGKAGKVANSIRTIVQASSYLKDNKRVKINIDSF